MTGEAPINTIAIVVVLSAFPFVTWWVFVTESGKLKEKFNELPEQRIPVSAYVPALFKSVAVGVFSLFLIVGFNHLPF